MQQPPEADPGSLRIRLRTDLRFTLQQDSPSYYLVEDPLNNRFFRLGLAEWSFLSLLDGQRTMREALRVANASAAEHKLAPNAAFSLAHWLVANGLARTDEADASNPSAPQQVQPKSTSPLSNPLFIKLPLGNPDLLLTHCLAYFHWMLGGPFFAIWLATVAVGGFQLFSNWGRFVSSLSNVFAPNNWLYLILTWILLKVVHELWHGLVCKRFGGNVPRFGVMFILFSPIAFVDVTTSWRFRSKWQRIYTAAAGMYIEFFIGAIAACIWAWSESPIVAHVCHNIVISATVSTVLFNANFLMRFDGYYILSDLLGIQNMYPKGQQYIHSLGRRFVLGLPPRPISARRGQLWIIKLYGFGSLVWRWVFYVGIIIIAAKMLGGAGIIFAGLAVVTWFALPALRLAKFLIYGRKNEQPNRVRFAVVATGFVGLVLFVSVLPWPGGLVSPGVIEYDPLTSIRTESQGFVEHVLVESGQSVSAGTAVAVLSDPDADQQLADINLAIQQSIIKSDILLKDGEMSQYLVENRNRAALVERRAELQKRVDSLTVRAPVDGRIVGRDLKSLVGQFVDMGTHLMAIAQEHEKEVLVSVDQSNVSFLRKQLNQPVRVRVLGGTSISTEARLVEIQPKASSRLPHPALSALSGGPLPVRTRNAENSTEAADAVELLTPRFVAKVSLSPQTAGSLFSGQQATVRLSRVGETIGQHLRNAARDWIGKKIDSANSAG